MPSFSNLPALFGRATVVLGEHAELHVTLGKLRQCCTLDDDFEDPPALHELLDEFETQLEAHFAAEEDEGYFGTLQTAFPTSSEAVEKLRAEHVVFIGTVRALRGMAAAPGRTPELTVTLRALLDDLARHENTESLLIRQYFSEGQI
jgi:hypothetical protein